jgi:hypothetical protein
MKPSALLALMVLTAACSASPAGDAAKTPQQAAPTASAAPALTSSSAPDIATASPAPVTPPEAAAVATSAARIPPAVLRACDLVAQVAARAKGVTITRGTGTFDDERERRTRFGCSVSLVGSTKALGASPNPVELWCEQFSARGWQEDVNHSADGPDGTSFAFVRAGVICIFQGQWDGGDDTDPSAKPDDAYTGAEHCAVNDARPPGLPALSAVEGKPRPPVQNAQRKRPPDGSPGLQRKTPSPATTGC